MGFFWFIVSFRRAKITNLIGFEKKRLDQDPLLKPISGNRGNCLVCGYYENLTVTHILPQSIGNKGMMFGTSFFGANKTGDTFAKTKFPNGVSFKTACAKCNSTIGAGADRELKKFCTKLEKNLSSLLKLPDKIEINCRPNLLIKAAISHLLSANYKRLETNFDAIARAVYAGEVDIKETELKVFIWPFVGNNYFLCRDFIKFSIAGKKPEQLHVLKLKPIAIAVTHGLTIENATCLNTYKTRKDKLLCTIPINIFHRDLDPYWPASPDGDNGILTGNSVSILAQKHKVK